MKKLKKAIVIILAIMFIILTLGFADVEIKFTDGSKFAYKGWLHLFDKK